MSAHRVEWVLIVRYGISAHRATYGRLPGNSYTKDYIQLSQKPDFIHDLKAAFPILAAGASSASINYKWPGGSAEGKIFRKSADRPHLTWETRNGAPAPWKMREKPLESTPETIRGNPSRLAASEADQEYLNLISSGFGQPYLVAVKLVGDPTALHLRVFVDSPEPSFAWADLNSAPPVIRKLAAATSQRSVLAWRLLTDTNRSETLFFDVGENGDPWRLRDPISDEQLSTLESAESSQDSLRPKDVDDDLLAESSAHSEQEIANFERRLESGNFAVPDTLATVKTRGSAQRVFAMAVKNNYGWRCALTGIKTRSFLIASHVVPWSLDESIRIDPSNGICLSVLIDRAFENGFINIEDDFSISLDFQKIGDDSELKGQLIAYDGMKLKTPNANPPKLEYLRRRRAL